jgi:hypothetical protein
MVIYQENTFANNKIKYPEAEVCNVSIIFFHAAKILLTVIRNYKCKSKGEEHPGGHGCEIKKAIYPDSLARVVCLYFMLLSSFGWSFKIGLIILLG